MTEMSVALLETSSCCCDMEKTENDCCSNEEKVIQWEADQQISSNYSFNKQLVPILLDHITSILDEEISEGFTTLYIEDPPPRLRRTFLLFHQFTFYG